MDLQWDDSEGLGETQATQTQHLTQTQPVASALPRPPLPPYWGQLIPLEHSSGLQTFSLLRGSDEYLIGRSGRGRQACDFILQSKKISGKHARIFREREDDTAVFIEDLSTNGTWINQVRAPKNAPVALNQGDEVSFGPVTGEPDDCRYIYRRTSPSTQSAGDSAEAGGLFEKYDLRQQVGKGSFATVRAAVQRSTGRMVAVKIINKRRFQANEKTMEMLRREVEICKTLRHPYIASFEDYYEDDTYTYMVLEYVDGGDLLEYVTGQGGLSEDVAQEMARQVCQAVAYLHSQGVAHRDLKPDNLLLTRGPQPVCKVSDFGLAKLATEATFLKTMCGTPSYLAPEVILQNEESGYSFACDAWSVGVLVYAALANALPFEEDEKEPLRDRMLKRQPDMALLRQLRISEAGQDFVKRLMVFNPRQRMTCAEALQHPWLRAVISRADSESSRASDSNASYSMLPAARVGSPNRAPRRSDGAPRPSTSTEDADDDNMTTLNQSDSSEYRKQLDMLNLTSPKAQSKPFSVEMEVSMTEEPPSNGLLPQKRKQPLGSAFSSNSDADSLSAERARKRNHLDEDEPSRTTSTS